MEVFTIPVEDKFIIYRPLRRLAFVGNRAMADLALQFAALPPGGLPDAPEEALAFLRDVGFTAPDPPPPPGMAHSAAFRPTSATLLMTGRCNLRCVYCYARGGEQDDRDLPLEAAKAAIDQVCRNAVAAGQSSFEVTFHGGGEPSLAWETVKAATAYARARAIPARLHMVSNGVWNRAQREWVVANLDGLTISMDGGQTTQDAQRPFPTGKGSFATVMQTTHRLDAAKFPYNVRMTCTPERFADLPEDVAFLCRETGCREIQVEPTFNPGRGAHHAPHPDQARAFIEAFLAAYDAAQSAGRFLFYSGARPWLIADAFCTAPLGGTLAINPRGEIVACYEITGGDHPLAEKSTLGWRDEASGAILIDAQRRDAFLSYLNSRRTPCRACFCYWHCAGDCYTRALEVERGENPWPYARCEINRGITAGLLLRSIAVGEGLYQGPQPGMLR